MLSAQDLNHMQRISPFRSRRLFDEFLPRGYEMTTLNTVEDKSEVIGLKVILGTLITLYDDYADRPDRLNSKLLQLLYRLPFETLDVHDAFLRPCEREALGLARSLFEKLMSGMGQLPNYESLIALFKFDLRQFFLANQYSEYLTQLPHLANGLENKLYLHHNMGIVMAGMIDLMSLTSFSHLELGKAREIFLLAQRAGRISNVLTTFEREQQEGDVTNELLISDRLSLEQELARIYEVMRETNEITAFSAKLYTSGFMQLHGLHLKMQGVI
jgi:hypothetical protein